MKNLIYASLTFSVLTIVSPNVFGQQYNTAEYPAAHYAVNNPPYFHTKKTLDAGYASHNDKVATAKEAKELFDYINSIRLKRAVSPKVNEPYYKSVERKLGIKFDVGFLGIEKDMEWAIPYTGTQGREFVVYRKKVGAFSLAMEAGFFDTSRGVFNTHIESFYLEDGPCMPWSVFAKGMGLANRIPDPTGRVLTGI